MRRILNVSSMSLQALELLKKSISGDEFVVDLNRSGTLDSIIEGRRRFCDRERYRLEDQGIADVGSGMPQRMPQFTDNSGCGALRSLCDPIMVASPY